MSEKFVKSAVAHNIQSSRSVWTGTIQNLPHFCFKNCGQWKPYIALKMSIHEQILNKMTSTNTFQLKNTLQYCLVNMESWNINRFRWFSSPNAAEKLHRPRPSRDYWGLVEPRSARFAPPEQINPWMVTAWNFMELWAFIWKEGPSRKKEHLTHLTDSNGKQLWIGAYP